MPLIRAMSILQAPSGEAKDRYISNFHFFVSGPLIENGAINIGDSLDDFWAAVDPFIPQSLVREEYRLYDLTDPKPREPTFVAPNTQPVGAGVPMPYEVATVLSFYSGRNLPRLRNRVYLGPITSDVVTTGEINSDPQIDPAFMQLVFDGANAMAANVRSTAGGVGDELQAGAWHTFSTFDVPGQTPVTNMWMDNAFDTQRRRGSAATFRLTEEVTQDA